MGKLPLLILEETIAVSNGTDVGLPKIVRFCRLNRIYSLDTRNAPEIKLKGNSFCYENRHFKKEKLPVHHVC